jgi:hypothetical protein
VAASLAVPDSTNWPSELELDCAYATMAKR